MKLYKITLRSRWGEPFVVTVPASSLDEAMKNITVEAGWIFSEYSEIGDTE